jgi:LacI family transcriptional regulator
VGVATRQSTDLIAIPDHQVAAAVRFIRENACQRITVDDVLRAVPMSRTLLERKFRKYMGIAPYEEILRIKLRRANELLLSTDLPICEVAERTGFATAEYFSASFKQRFGFSPKGLRQSKCFDVP